MIDLFPVPNRDGWRRYDKRERGRSATHDTMNEIMPKVFMPRRAGFGLMLALGLVLAIAAPGQSAHAQRWHGGPALSAREILADLQDEGFRRLSQPVRNQDVYFLDAIDPYNVPVRVIVDAFDGRILAVHRQRGRELPQVDPFDEDIDDGVITVPRRPPAQRAPRQASASSVKVAPPQPTNPALTPKNPTVVKTSPLAIPKDKDGKPAEKTDPVATMPGSKTAPRVIPLAPAAGKVQAPVTTPVPVAPSSAIPPPSVLDDAGLSSRPVTPQVPPAPLE